ncbi:MAG: hypothetical protein ACRDTT_11120 [Pseudonocardiaceae bacterium]
MTVRGQHSELPERFFAEGETRRRPLKGRGHRTTRKIPVPAPLVPRFAAHLEQFVERKPDALLFTTPTGRRIHTSNFHRSVWRAAREQVFEEGSPLREVRRHYLRHSAITAWLNSGVLLKTAQKWSGAPDGLRPIEHLPRCDTGRSGRVARPCRGGLPDPAGAPRFVPYWCRTSGNQGQEGVADG